MSAPVRVRYAPSPTGDPHVGNIRAALFDWLLARRTGGAFIVRIEDTDRAREIPGAKERILEALTWLGLDWDEGPGKDGPFAPYAQSERQALGVYAGPAERLLADGAAYLCYCATERLDAMRKAQQSRGEPPRYDRTCRDPAQREAMRALNEAPVVRFKTPLEGRLTVRDAVRGEVEFDLGLLDDFVILKADGFPTYHLGHIVDDHLMEISHVLRGEEWLPSLPRHHLLYQALGFEMPVMAHLPIVLGPDRAKLSKRHGATSVLDYRDKGYLPEAMVNFLALLGWSLDGSTELIPRADLVRRFGLERVLSSPAVFDVQKLDWMNGVYMRSMTHEELAHRLLPLLEASLPKDAPRPIDPAYLAAIVPLEQERLKTLSDAPDLLSFFFVEQPRYNPMRIIRKGMARDGAREAIDRSLRAAEALDEWDAPALERAYRALADELGLTSGQLFGALRVAVTGREAAPPLFDTMAVLGKQRVVARLRAAGAFLSAIPVAC